MKEINLTKGFKTQVDDEDFEYLNQWKWFALKGKYTCYACRKSNKRDKINNVKRQDILMHREIINIPPKKQTDHKDGNGLNNQKENLRYCSHIQNCWNKNKTKGKSKYKGIHYINNKYIQARINYKKKEINLGMFKNEIDAAIAYDEAAKKYFGEFANLNFPEHR